ncbi:helix-turn-helix domain-containing protein [Aestuariispira insulae]|uniref:Helix-turn-helix protein n=1 Tax=Aestuariispira insulae TaxID=1461337 RepID=A0A3D9HM28_9PROT|nr:helix-turn-helix transcriptional regulator [Aestuariispira insulae]RED49956.1 helix-turn-helix protein [Aestuariispira insulae]
MTQTETGGCISRPFSFPAPPDTIWTMQNAFDGKELRRWRRAQEIKQDSLAETLGVTQASVSRWEQGQQAPSPHILRILEAMITGQGRTGLDGVLKRLIQSSRDSVHIVEDRSHRLLATSQTRLDEWQRQGTDLMGQSLWRYATEEIAAAEAALDDLGWWDDGIDCLAFPVQGRDGPPMRVKPQHVLWERIRLDDGSYGRLTTSIDGQAFDALPPSYRRHF